MGDRAKASAPASIGNVGVGFDVLGQALDAARDSVIAVREDKPGVRLGEVSGLVSSLPEAPERNTALAAAKALLDAVEAPFGVTLSVEKGVPMSAGMGGSAASAVAAVVAVNALLEEPLPLPALLPYALAGERVSSDPPPWDNVAASLLGGLVLVARERPDSVHRLPAPRGIVAVLLHPPVQVETKAARRLLRPDVPMRVAVEHSRRMAAFVAGCASGNVELLRAGLDDLLVEPQRMRLLPALAEVKRAALGAGAIGCSFSGSGPSVFAWALAHEAGPVERAMAAALEAAGLKATAYRAPASSAGARLEPAEAAAKVAA
jgi:homoserine kinase